MIAFPYTTNKTTATSQTSTGSKLTPLVIVALIGILILTTAVYWKTLFPWLCSDDFVVLEWLHRVKVHPELVWRNFTHTWLDVPTTKFYRPLWGVSMAIDYLLWKENFVGFHVTNVLLHLLNVVLVFALGRSLFQTNTASKGTSANIFALAASSLFAVHPIHPEAVAWLTGRVDAITTVFYMSTLWLYIRWRSGASLNCLILANMSFCAALATKEMAISLPATIACYELIMKCDSNGKTIQSQTSSLLKQLQKTVTRTSSFWLILVAYFGLRRITLGTFVGGYDDGLTINDWTACMQRLTVSVHTILFPININIVTGGNFFAKFWRLALYGCTALISIRLVTNSELKRIAAFLAGTFVITLIPLYRVMCLTPDLQDTRYAYLPSVPLCLFFALALANYSWQFGAKLRNAFNAACLVCFAVLLVSSTVICWKNTSAWVQAGRESNKIMLSFDKFFERYDNQHYLLTFGLPDNISGAPVARNATGGLTRSRPRLIAAPDLEDGAPYGFWKQSFKDNADKIHVFRWNSARGEFVEQPILCTGGPPKMWQANELKQLVVQPESTARFCPEGLVLQSKGMSNIKLALDGTHCWHYDVLILNIKDLNYAPNKSPLFADLHFSTNLVDSRKITATATGKQTDQSLVFLLHRYPTWLMGEKGHDVNITFPQGSHVLITGVQLIASENYIPTVRFSNSGCMGNGNRLYFRTKNNSDQLEFDASAIPGAKGCTVEIAKPGACFEEYSAAPDDSRTVMHRYTTGASKGVFTLNKSMFDGTGNYWLRVRATDAHGNFVGAPSDHIVVCPNGAPGAAK